MHDLDVRDSINTDYLETTFFYTKQLIACHVARNKEQKMSY